MAIRTVLMKRGEKRKQRFQVSVTRNMSLNKKAKLEVSLRQQNYHLVIVYHSNKARGGREKSQKTQEGREISKPQIPSSPKQQSIQ
jgi:hypothetical protein